MVDFWLDRVNHLYGACFKTSSQMWPLISLTQHWEAELGRSW